MCLRFVYLCSPPHFRYYGESGRCEKCDKSCKACRGPRPTDCQSCDKFFFLLRSKGQCHRTCPEHYFADQHAQTCERCHPTCDKCDGENMQMRWKFEGFSFLFIPSPSYLVAGAGGGEVPLFPNFSSGFSSISTLSLHSPLLQHPCCLPNLLSIKVDNTGIIALFLLPTSFSTCMISSL